MVEVASLLVLTEQHGSCAHESADAEVRFERPARLIHNVFPSGANRGRSALRVSRSAPRIAASNRDTRSPLLVSSCSDPISSNRSRMARASAWRPSKASTSAAFAWSGRPWHSFVDLPQFFQDGLGTTPEVQERRGAQLRGAQRLRRPAPAPWRRVLRIMRPPPRDAHRRTPGQRAGSAPGLAASILRVLGKLRQLAPRYLGVVALPAAKQLIPAQYRQIPRSVAREPWRGRRSTSWARRITVSPSRSALRFRNAHPAAANTRECHRG